MCRNTNEMKELASEAEDVKKQVYYKQDYL